MTNPTYLWVSYFGAALAGVALALLTAAGLSSPLGKALAGLAGPLAALLRRALPAWLVLAVLLGFLSVSYFDCQHTSYRQVVADRQHLAATTRQHGGQMVWYLAAGLTAYALALVPALAVKSRRKARDAAGRG